MGVHIEEKDGFRIIHLSDDGTKPDKMIAKVPIPVGDTSREQSVYIGRIIDGEEKFGGACFSREDLVRMLLLLMGDDFYEDVPPWKVLNAIKKLKPKKD